MTPRSLLLFATAVLLPGLNAGANGAPPCDNLAARLASTEKAQDARISEVKSIRRYVLHNPRWKKDATATVLFTYQPDGRKRYEVLSMNAEGLQEHVLHRILDGEAEAASKKSEDSSISPENYEITPIGYDMIRGRRCRLVSLTPLKKSRTLIEGRAWIDEREAVPVRVEGRTAKSLSFWVGRPYIVQDFRKVGDFWLSSENHSVADVKMIGKTELEISFVDYAVTPKNGEVQIACSGHCSPRLGD